MGEEVRIVIKACKLEFRASKETRECLFACNRLSGQIWNDTLDLAKNYHQEHGQWIDKKQLHLATKGQYPLHSQSIQAVYERYLQARENALKARAKGYTAIRYPWRQKKNFNTRWKKDGFKIYPHGRIELSMGIWQGQRQKPLVVKVKKLPPYPIKEIELIWDRKLKLALTYDDGLEVKEATGVNMVSIDLGEIHAIAAVCENNQGLIITGRQLRSTKRLRNKKIQELQKKISRCQKHSRQWKKYRKAMNYVLSKSEAQLKDGLHKISRFFVNWCINNQVKEVIVGDVEGVQRNTANKKTNPRKKRRNRKQNQKLSQWQFGKLYKYLEYKLGAENIALRKVNEAYTSQTCPVCGRKKKVSGRVYRCYCGYSEHRDIHGAKNILTKEKHGEFRDFVVNEIKYLRIA
jgi:putative transposase